MMKTDKKKKVDFRYFTAAFSFRAWRAIKGRRVTSELKDYQ